MRPFFLSVGLAGSDSVGSFCVEVNWKMDVSLEVIFSRRNARERCAPDEKNTHRENLALFLRVLRVVSLSVSTSRAPRGPKTARNCPILDSNSKRAANSNRTHSNCAREGIQNSTRPKRKTTKGRRRRTKKRALFAREKREKRTRGEDEIKHAPSHVARGLSFL